MKGIMEFIGAGTQLVGKIKEFPNKAEFAEACVIEHGDRLPEVINQDDIYQASVRYYPYGTEDTRLEHGNDGVYLFVDKEAPGTFKVWMIDITQ
ncbi:hypothetical protein PBV87_09180 [Niameybacter massiliensis]|uniref:Uncharacterized protein n=1 Tax=Holtiella tumoricola TaxID=3018743 RepID=A0AA42DM36_9FIRM|nr:hypothetical protein [Holtiella tumoricola]MDA3731647.1 hypothetical protein [Holtiella tumoricola]